MSGVVRARLRDIEVFQVSRGIVGSTLEVLRAFGRSGLEGLVLWVGSLDGRAATIEEAVVPDQHPLRSEDGVGYFVGPDALFDLNVMLSSAGQRLLAQVHSHPGAAYHSAADDAYAIVTTEGGLSLVVPDFANVEPDPARWAVYRLVGGRWREVDAPGRLIEAK